MVRPAVRQVSFRVSPHAFIGINYYPRSVTKDTDS